MTNSRVLRITKLELRPDESSFMARQALTNDLWPVWWSWTRSWRRSNSLDRCRGRCGGGCGAISCSSVQIAGVSCAGPDDHFTPSPYCGVKRSAIRHIRGAGGSPTVGPRIVPATGIQKSADEGIESCPHNHFVAGPHCRVRSPLRRDISQGGRCPAIGAWIVPTASV